MTSPSLWVELDMERKIVGLLAEQANNNVGSDFGRPYVTAYQLAIMFAERYPEDFELFDSRGFPLGGLNSGTSNSLPQYLAGRLANRSVSQSMGIEGSFLSSEYVRGFDSYGELIEPSVPQISMFRLR